MQNAQKKICASNADTPLIAVRIHNSEFPQPGSLAWSCDSLLITILILFEPFLDRLLFASEDSVHRGSLFVGIHEIRHSPPES